MENIHATPTSDTESTSLPFIVTDAAMTRLKYLLSDEPKETYLRVEVLGGGCSGFQYHYDLCSKPIVEEDIIIERNGGKVVIDTTSLDIMKGSTLDYVEELASAGFIITNPNATASCGCGNSFSVAF